MKKGYANLYLAVLTGLLFTGCEDKPPVGNGEGSRQIGEICDDAHKCMEGLFCEDGLCRVPCIKNEDCASGEECLNNRCVKTNKQEPAKIKQKGESCDALYTCIDGLVCKGGKCMAACRDKSACEANEECQNGFCVPQSGPVVREVKGPELSAFSGSAADDSGATIQGKGLVVTGYATDNNNNSIEISSGYWTK